MEASIHYIALITPADLAENSYLVGPRFIYPRGRFNVYAKALFGIGTIVIQEAQDNPRVLAGNYFAYSFGGGVDIRATKHLVVRAIDFEYQHWSYPNWPDPDRNHRRRRPTGSARRPRPTPSDDRAIHDSLSGFPPGTPAWAVNFS